MTQENPQPDQAAEQLRQLQLEFSKAGPAQSTLEEVPDDVLPEDYRSAIQIRVSSSGRGGDAFYIAFSDDPKNLEPTDDDLLPSAHIKRISGVTGPRGLGRMIKEWVDTVREAESKQE